MSATETVVTIDKYWINSFAIPVFSCYVLFYIAFFLESDVDINQLFDAHELIEGEPLFRDLSLIVLVDTVNLLISYGKRCDEVCLLELLHLKFWHNERELSKFGLFLLFDRHSHPLENSWFMKLITLCIWRLFWILFDLRMEVRMRVSMELPDVDAIIFSC